MGETRVKERDNGLHINSKIPTNELIRKRHIRAAALAIAGLTQKPSLLRPSRLSLPHRLRLVPTIESPEKNTEVGITPGGFSVKVLLPLHYLTFSPRFPQTNPIVTKFFLKVGAKPLVLTSP